MPHMFSNRLRLHNLTKDINDLPAQFRWESMNAFLYIIGGFVFIFGSIMFFPNFNKYSDIGAWTFFAGSLAYLVVTVHDMVEVRRHWLNRSLPDNHERLDYIAAGSYVAGTILFTVGSIFFTSAVDWFISGAWCFIAGSLLFVAGACINVVEIIRSRSLITLQLMNYTAVAFVVGAVLFTVASIPYLLNFKIASDRITLYAFLAWQYLFGSILFFLGGVFNYWRAYVVAHEEMGRRNRP